MKLTKLFLFFLFMPFFSEAQYKPIANIDSIAEYFLRYSASFDKEKILLQTDRHIYRTGETIYFKLFPIDSITKQLSARPRRLYVDIVNNQDQVFGQLLLNASNLKTSGEFVLNDSLKEGFYWIRAYTEKMISQNLKDITVQPVFVVNPRKRNFDNQISLNKDSFDSAQTPVIHIFPEGGNLISAINSTVGVKVTDQNGNPMSVEGIVKDNADSVYASFTTNSQGLSKFFFNPIWYHRYSIYILNKNKFDSVAVLPPINFFAGQLAVIEQTDNYVKVRIALEDSLYSENYTTYLIAISGDSICYSAVGKGMYEAQIPLNNFSHGVASLLLFNTKRELISERDIFIKKENYNIDIHSNKENYGPRENVKIDVSLTDKNNKPLLAALAFSVTDTSVSDTMINYFTDNAMRNLSPAEADLVMLTRKNQYSKFTAAYISDSLKRFNDQEKINDESSPEDKNNTSSFSISGIVINRKNLPAAKKLVTIFSNKKYTLVNTDTTDTNGRFRFYVPDYSDSTGFFVQVSNFRGKKESEYKILYDTMVMPHFITPHFLKKTFIFNEKEKKIINEFSNLDSVAIGTGKEWLKPVIVKRYKKNKVTYDETKRVSPFSHIITPDMINRGSRQTGNALLMVPGVHSTGDNIGIGGPTGFAGGMHPPILVLNGVVMDSQSMGSNLLEFVNSIPVSTIDFIEVLTGPEGAIYGMQGGNGVILINTTSHPRNNEADVTGLSSFYPRGFHTSQPFIMPDYNNKETKASKMQDLRTTIYWNGDIITNKNGKASFNFFTADKPATYLITVCGISANGDKIYKTVTINRK